MDTNLSFEICDVDQLSGIPTPHLSYAINQLLPLRLIGKHRYQDVEKVLDEKALSDDSVEIMAVGSLAEALNMPPIIEKKQGHTIKGDYLSDMDFMFVVKSAVSTFDTKKMDSGDYFSLIDTNDMHSGYARVWRSGKYLDHDCIQNEIKEGVMKTLLTSSDLNVEFTGPAVTTPKQTDLNVENFKTFDKSKPICSTDHVMGFPCEEWPPVAEEWKTRSRTQGWPSLEAIESLISNGCHVVPVQHRLTKPPLSAHQWRLSFTITERNLARHHVNDYQRQGFVFLKVLYHECLKQMQLISSYHLKTVFFYSCEIIPISAWKENLGSCVLYMLDLLLECVSKGFLPNYFIPENNMIDYLTEEERDSIIETVMETRIDPLSHVFCFTDDKTIGQASLMVSFRELMELVVKDMHSFIEHKEIRRSILESFSISSMKYILAQLYEGKVGEAVYIAEDLYRLLEKFRLTSRTLPDFFYWSMCQNISNTELGVKFMEHIVRTRGSEPGYETCKNNLPCLYHILACKYSKTSLEHGLYVSHSELAFRDLLKDSSNIPISCEFALLLMKQSRHAEAIPLLQEALRSKSLASCKNVYNKKEMCVLDETLQREVAEHPPLRLSSVALTYYLLYSCVHQGDSSSKECRLRDIKDEFRLFSEKENCARTFSLLGYCFVQTKDWKEGSEAFRRAIECKLPSTNNEIERTPYTLALAMKKHCDANANSF
ncbi:hypothetical protein FSP39_019993 [Pinctada imbricata]|uniref:Mab-21-like HhH/H2TH-like domain-containing protein n=1 Tax=Pinctada imbricata TaxID=66713 RepID=A0AA89BRJ8_PINIB|nr:hypothetical protein FSP39_019993 [Pinctada imbricata]